MSDDEQSTRRDAGGVGVNLLTLLAQASLPAFYAQLTRLLGPSGYGIYSLATSMVDALSGITMFGMDLAVNREVPVALAANDPERALRAVSGALRVVLLSGLLVAVGVGVAAPYIASVQHQAGLVGPLRALILMPIAYHVTTIFIVATQAKMVMKYDFWARGLFQPLCLLALTSLALRTGGGVFGAAVAVAAGMSLTALLAAALFAREYPLAATLRAANRGPTDWALVRLGAPIVVLGLVWNIQGAVDLWMIDHFRGSTDVGIYKGCLIWVISLTQVRGTFAPVINARLPTLLAAGDTAATNAFIQRQMRWVALLAMPLCVLFVGFGEGLLAVYGRGFLPGTTALAILSLGALSAALAVPPYVLLLSGNTRLSTLSGVSCLAVQFIGLPLLIPRYGLTGAAIASASGMVLSQVIQHLFVWRIARVHGFSLGFAKVALAALAGLAVGRLVYGLLPALIAVRFFGGVGTAAAVYLVVLVALGLNPDEIDLARTALRDARAFIVRFTARR